MACRGQRSPGDTSQGFCKPLWKRNRTSVACWEHKEVGGLGGRSVPCAAVTPTPWGHDARTTQNRSIHCRSKETSLFLMLSFHIFWWEGWDLSLWWNLFGNQSEGQPKHLPKKQGEMWGPSSLCGLTLPPGYRPEREEDLHSSFFYTLLTLDPR